jgi:hypothetical protein
MNIKTLLPELRKLVTDLAGDLLVRSMGDCAIDAGLRDAFHQIEKGGRTAQAFEVWRDDYLDQVAVAWVLACVFVRFMEDNHLIDECWLAGEGERRKLAEDTHELFFREHPHDTDREYFQHVFKEVGKIPAAKDLFAEGKTPLWAVAPSGDAAMKLLKFWREIDAETGELKRRINHELHELHESDKKNKEQDHDSSSIRVIRVIRGSDPTRFLGDLYQELSERAKKKFALLQTPVFVEEFILDRTLTPALDEFGLEKVRMIDPTCGSGHFLLGGFARLFDLWCRRESNEIVAAQKALDGVWGVDINPFAVAIARFRLIVAAVQACGIKRLKQAPAWKIHLATGDSLLFGSRWNRSGEKVTEQGWFASEEGSWAPEIYACEDKAGLESVLGQQYHVVAGNPPYITVKDSRLNEAYRQRYPKVCHRQYSVAVPFAERFFDLALSSESGPCGYVGMITANSFMKREFGRKLIEEFFPKVDLSHVVDTSGAYIPGHGTPTVILFGRNRAPVGDHVRAVLGIKGEPTTPDDPKEGLVWRSIVCQIDRASAKDVFTSTADVSRTTLARHPWSIGGGGAAELKELLDATCSATLGEMIREIGFGAVTRDDEVYLISDSVARRHRIPATQTRPLVSGDEIRDWVLSNPTVGLFPYDPVSFVSTAAMETEKYLWPWKAQLSIRVAYGLSQIERGLKWFEYSMLFSSRLQAPLAIGFAAVATHNHFVLDRAGRVFRQSAPIIKLRREAGEADHLDLLGILNSSTACFWMKQCFQTKGSSGIGRGVYDERWEIFYDHPATGLEQLPVPEQKPKDLASELDSLGQKYLARLPEVTAKAETPSAEGLEVARGQAEAARGRMIALQEELDWHTYHIYGLLSGDLRCGGGDLPVISIGQRAFEIVMARQISEREMETSWFERHNSAPITEIPSHWPAAYRKLVERRIKLIETNKEIALIEKPEYKRRWNDEPWEEQQERALKNWLLDRLETPKYRKSTKENPELTTTAQMADVASADAEFLQVAALYRGRPDFNVAALVAELVEAEAVPFLPILRYKPAGLRKRELWERTWDLQRQEDKDQTTNHTNHTNEENREIQPNSDSSDFISVISVIGGSNSDALNSGNSTSGGLSIPVPPKYTSADFLKTDYWRLRGKLDVPKERWISYPYCSTESDPTLVVGCAGWNHLEQATALVAYYDARKREGWDAKRLTPLLAGLDQLLPWIHQWHPEVDPAYGETAGQSFETLLEQDAHELGVTLDDVRQWTPPEKQRKTRTTRKKKAVAVEEEDE